MLRFIFAFVILTQAANAQCPGGVCPVRQAHTSIQHVQSIQHTTQRVVQSVQHVQSVRQQPARQFIQSKPLRRLFNCR